LLIRDVYRGSYFSIPDPGSKRHRTRICNKDLIIFNPKTVTVAVGNIIRYFLSGDPDLFLSRIQILDPGVKKHWIPAPQDHW
jgi:hypothetical protein